MLCLSSYCFLAVFQTSIGSFQRNVEFLKFFEQDTEGERYPEVEEPYNSSDSLMLC